MLWHEIVFSESAVQAVTHLPERWRQIADALEEIKVQEASAVLRLVAEQLERALDAHDSQPLTLRQAAEESGYSEDSLGDLIRKKKIPNAGEKGAPRILRQHLPRKPRKVAKGQGDSPGSATASEIVRQALEEVA